MDEEKEKEIQRLWQVWEKEEGEKLRPEEEPPLGEQAAAQPHRDLFFEWLKPRLTWWQRFKNWFSWRKKEKPVEAELPEREVFEAKEEILEEPFEEIREESPMPEERIPLFRRNWIRFSILALIIAVIVLDIFWFYEEFKVLEKSPSERNVQETVATQAPPVTQAPSPTPSQSASAPAPQSTPSQEQIDILKEELRELRDKVEKVNQGVDQRIKGEFSSLRESLQQDLEERLSVFQERLVSQVESTIRAEVQQVPQQPTQVEVSPPPALVYSESPPMVPKGPPPGWYVRDPRPPY